MKRFQIFKYIDGELVYTDHRYLVVNIDEPYAEKVFELIKEHEKLKGTWDGPETFKEFIGELNGKQHD